jgi:cytochrome c-type biogenesis protein CcmH/NrfG
VLYKILFRILLVLSLFIVAACSGTGPKNKAFSRLEMADKAYAQGRWVEAEQHYLSITQVAPNDFYAWFRLGNARLRQGNLEAAIHAYESAIQRDPHQPKPHHNLGEAYLLLAWQSLEEAYNLTESGSQERLAVQQKLNKLQAIIYKPVSDLPSPAKGLIRY